MFAETKLFICALIVSTLPVIIFQDIYYKNYQPLVKIGQRAISGETLIAKK